MNMHHNLRPSNEKGQFILPPIPAGTSPALVALIEQYRAGFWSTEEDEQPRWEGAAKQILHFEPASLTDLAAKLTIAIHYADPGCEGRALTVTAPSTEADRLAVEMKLAALDWLLANVASASTREDAWAIAEAAYAKAHADLDALPTPYADEEADRLSDVRQNAIDTILALPATTMAQALRKIELAMFDGTMVRTGVDFPALLTDAKRLATAEVDPVSTAWASFKSAFTSEPVADGDAEERRFYGITDAADDILVSVAATTFQGAAYKLRRSFIALTQDRWAERLAIGEDTSDHRRQLRLSDIYTRMLWSAIEDVERMAKEARA